MARLGFAALLFLPVAAFAQFAGSYVHRAPQGAVTLTLQQQGHAVSGSMRGLDGSQIEFEGALRDNGKGIAADVLPKIFDPFFTTKEVGKGTGLGLSIAYKIVEAHGGRIAVDSKPGAGTRFTVRLPVHPPDDTVAVV